MLSHKQKACHSSCTIHSVQYSITCVYDIEIKWKKRHVKAVGTNQTAEHSVTYITWQCLHFHASLLGQSFWRTAFSAPPVQQFSLNKRIHSSVASSARSPYASSTGVVCVWKPVMVFGLPAWPTTSTACKACNTDAIKELL